MTRKSAAARARGGFFSSVAVFCQLTRGARRPRIINNNRVCRGLVARMAFRRLFGDCRPSRGRHLRANGEAKCGDARAPSGVHVACASPTYYAQHALRRAYSAKSSSTSAESSRHRACSRRAPCGTAVAWRPSCALLASCAIKKYNINSWHPLARNNRRAPISSVGHALRAGASSVCLETGMYFDGIKCRYATEQCRRVGGLRPACDLVR